MYLSYHKKTHLSRKNSRLGKPLTKGEKNGTMTEQKLVRATPRKGKAKVAFDPNEGEIKIIMHK
jgi:hypothetical protein